MGAHFKLPIHSMNWDEIEQVVKLAGLQVLIADMDGQSCWDIDLRQPVALLSEMKQKVQANPQRVGKWQNQHSNVWDDGVPECRCGRVCVDV
jgi:hypothetical protein